MFNFLKPSVSDFNSVTREVQKINSLKVKLNFIRCSDTRRVQKLIKQYKAEQDFDNILPNHLL